MCQKNNFKNVEKINTLIRGNVCPKCGGEIDPSTSNCFVCGGTAWGQTPSRKKNSLGFRSAFFTVIFSFLLIVSLVLLVLLLFIRALSENVALPAVGPVSGDWIALFFGSWYSLVLGSALVLIPTLMIVVINTHRARRIFLAIGCSGIVSAMLSVTAAITRIQILQLLSGEWQDILVNATAVFKDFGIVCAMILIVIGAACLSIYSCIAVVKGGRHEKDT